MNFLLDRNQAIAPLSLVTSVVERRQTLPILSNVLIECSENKLRLIGTDLEVEVQIEVPVDQSVEGATTVNARKLLDICRTLPESSTIKINQKEDQVKIQSGRSRFTLQSLSADDFPRLKESERWEERVKLTQTQLRQLFETTAFSMAQQDVRYFLNGVLLELDDDKLTAVATDGHRLARSVTTLSEAVGDHREAIVPRKAVQELARFLDDTDDPVVLEMNPNHLRFSRNRAVLTTKIIDGKFPDYRSVISQNLLQKVSVERVALYDVLARTAVLTNDKYRGVRLEVVPGAIKVAAHNPDQEEANDEVLVDYEGEDIEIGFNVTYLMDALRALSGGSVEIYMQDGNSGCLIQAPDDPATQYLIMPMRL